VTAVFNSHVHSYQRFGPLKDLEVHPEGIVYVVSAGGGAPLYAISQDDCNLVHGTIPCDAWTGEAHRPVTAVRAESVYHFLMVHAAQDRLTVEAIAPDGAVLDRFVVSRGPACGNGIREPAEECDDGNLLDGDECSCECVIERADFVRGEVNRDGRHNVADPVYLLQHLFIRGPVPPCRDAADANDDGRLNIADAVYMLGYLFVEAQGFPAPFPERGPDPTADDLGCARDPGNAE
jgi:cysteine-rich repeat protein